MPPCGNCQPPPRRPASSTWPPPSVRMMPTFARNPCSSMKSMVRIDFSTSAEALQRVWAPARRPGRAHRVPAGRFRPVEPAVGRRDQPLGRALEAVASGGRVLRDADRYGDRQARPARRELERRRLDSLADPLAEREPRVEAGAGREHDELLAAVAG